MLTVRLPEDMEEKISQIAASEKRTKTQIVREALERYLEARQSRKSSYDLGAELFGKQGSGRGNLSSDYRRLVKEKIRARRAD
jgi:hypothetical protein